MTRIAEDDYSNKYKGLNIDVEWNVQVEIGVNSKDIRLGII
jgi:hypothetical protein